MTVLREVPARERRIAPQGGVGDGSRGRPGLGYQPALDGLRALAVAAVLLFHGKVPWLRGGYVGVSVFFTLSGFLITSLLIREHDWAGRIDARAFYARRARRLLPAGTACLLAVAAVAAAGGFGPVPDLRADLVGAALQVFNWTSLAGGESYGAVLAQSAGAVSPLDHYWSLAIEEQFYWVWPIALTALAGVAQRRRTRLSKVLAVPTVAFVALAPAIARLWGPDAAYWATPARAGEILTGAVAAALVAEGRVPAWARAATLPCLAAIAGACALFPSGSGPAYGGWLPALSVVSAAALLGLQAPGPVRAALSWRPLVYLGTISYGLYLYHWPIYALIDEERVGFGGPGLLAVRLALSFIAASESAALLEQPFRRGDRAPGLTLALASLATVTAVVVGLAVVPTPEVSYLSASAADPRAAIEVGPVGDLRPVTADAAEPVGQAGAAPVAVVADMFVPSRPVRIAVVGDSTAEAVGVGLASWAREHPALAQVSLATKAGCGFVREGVRVFPDKESEVEPQCGEYVGRGAAARVAELRPDVVVVLDTWDVLDRRWDGGPVVGPADAPYRERIGRDYAALTASLIEAGAPRVVWLKQPPFNPYWSPAPEPGEEVERHRVVWDQMESMAAADPGVVRVADLAGWVASAGLGSSRDLRPDGIHLSPSAAVRLATDWLGPRLVAEALAA
ncbi:MAG: putative acyltransferase [Acidimicrobiales bacterium]|nr:putative acyltransferase [Acidimicrobiales bacterium]